MSAPSISTPVPSAALERRLPVGADVIPGVGVDFRVWAPKSRSVAVEVYAAAGSDEREMILFELEGVQDGYFQGFTPKAKPGMTYRFRLEEGSFPDPASRFQPQGPHGPSQIIAPAHYSWTDQRWQGVPDANQVIYELHIGTFTAAGTWRAAAEQLPELARLGITTLEVMPVADFPGRFGWGYDGVNLFAPNRLYGAPDDFRTFVDQAHQLGLAVILDVVYNHLGPDGNYLRHFSDDYFTDRYQNEWGQALNFDGKNSAPVRSFVISNAAYWIEEFHLDGLRLDATQQIFDASTNNIMAAISRKVRDIARGRRIYIVAENEPQQALLTTPFEQGGYGLDALWNDDFHHSAIAALTGHNGAYYTDYRGAPQEFISALKHGFLYQGQWYSWQKKRRGTPALHLKPQQFVCFLENHDQVANTLRGSRLAELTTPGRLKALTTVMVLGPGTPMFFQGQEFGSSAPFLYFADHHSELATLVGEGRKEFLKQFPNLACPEVEPLFPGPESAQTFQLSKLDLSERTKHSAIYQFHRDLIALRRDDPVFSRQHTGKLDGAVLANEAFALRFFGESDDRLLLVNLGLDLCLSPIPEPLLAASAEGGWETLWSTEAPCYGGCGTPQVETPAGWHIPGHAAVVLKPCYSGFAE